MVDDTKIRRHSMDDGAVIEESRAAKVDHVQSFPRGASAYKEGHKIIIEDSQGEVIAILDDRGPLVLQSGDITPSTLGSNLTRTLSSASHGFYAYQVGRHIVIEDDDGEIIYEYDIPEKDKEPKAHKEYKLSSQLRGLNHGVNKILSACRLKKDAHRDTPRPPTDSH
jgi:hypothetical protein